MAIEFTIPEIIQDLSKLKELLEQIELYRKFQGEEKIKGILLKEKGKRVDHLMSSMGFKWEQMKG
jgi:hypothetical protein